jgi:hypothetical protein
MVGFQRLVAFEKNGPFIVMIGKLTLPASRLAQGLRAALELAPQP